ncbi:MAG: hypothetical protein ACNS61_01660 [Candidatus Wenzhouxiangella sp. M2_3B_020]
MIRLTIAAIASLLALQNAAGQDIDARIAATLEDHVQPFRLVEGRLQGQGANQLVAEGRRASFFALGESHLNEETPALTEALLEALKPAGYSALAIETGPMIAEHAAAALRGGRRDALAGLFAEVPFTAAFIDHAPEFGLLERAVDLGYALWGLDQVFIGGARFNLDSLVELAPSDEARKLAAAALERAERGYVRFAETGDSAQGFLVTASEAEYDALRAAFDGVPEAGRILDELAASTRIYRLFGQGENYRSNHERIELMKRHLADNLRETDTGTKVFLKFGSVHMQRGYSPLNQLDLGNAAAELGFYRGGGSLHVKVTALGSTGLDGEFDDWTESSPYLDRFEAAMPEDSEWAVFDLRALRPIFHDRDNADGRGALAEIVWGYDLLVLAREFTRAEPLPGVPSPPGG